MNTHAPDVTIDRRTILIVAGEAGCDPRTVARVARGEPVRGLIGERVREALERKRASSDAHP